MEPVDPVVAAPRVPDAVNALSAAWHTVLPEAAADGASAGGARGDPPAAEPGAVATPAPADQAAWSATSVPPGVAEAQAQQGRATLGRMATEVAPPLAMAPAEPMPAAAGAAATARPELASVPVFVPPWQPPQGERVRARAARDEPVRGRRRTRDGERDVDRNAADDDARGQTAPAFDEAGPDDAQQDDAAAAAASAQAWIEWLRRHAQHATLRELGVGRRVLVVAPAAGPQQGVVAATAVLLSHARAPRWRARWWPGAAAMQRTGWQPHRVFRAGDDANVLASRAGTPPCSVQLGARAAQLPDAERATLLVAERVRFLRELGVQWSLCIAVAPPGEAP